MLLMQMGIVKCWSCPFEIIDEFTLFFFNFSKFQSQIEDNSVAIVILFAEMFWSFAFVFIVCFLGQKVSDEFEEIKQEIHELHWYQFPIDMWQPLSFLIIGSQQRARLSVFGSISCDRKAFKNVSSFNHLETTKNSYVDIHFIFRLSKERTLS